MDLEMDNLKSKISEVQEEIEVLEKELVEATGKEIEVLEKEYMEDDTGIINISASRAPSMIAIVPDNTVVGRFVRVMDSDAARTVMALYSRAAGVFTAVLLEEWCSNWRTATSALSVINSSEDLQAASQSPVGSFWQDTASRRREEKLKKMINSFLVEAWRIFKAVDAKVEAGDEGSLLRALQESPEAESNSASEELYELAGQLRDKIGRSSERIDNAAREALKRRDEAIADQKERDTLSSFDASSGGLGASVVFAVMNYALKGFEGKPQLLDATREFTLAYINNQGSFSSSLIDFAFARKTVDGEDQGWARSGGNSKDEIWLPWSQTLVSLQGMNPTERTSVWYLNEMCEMWFEQALANPLPLLGKGAFAFMEAGDELKNDDELFQSMVLDEGNPSALQATQRENPFTLKNVRESVGEENLSDEETYITCLDCVSLSYTVGILSNVFSFFTQVLLLSTLFSFLNGGDIPEGNISDIDTRVTTMDMMSTNQDDFVGYGMAGLRMIGRFLTNDH